MAQVQAAAASAAPLPTSGNGTRTAGYLDGAPAEDAFQGLIDRGLFSDEAPAKPVARSEALPSPSPPDGAQPTPEPVSTEAAPAEAAAAEAPAGEDYASLDDYLTKAQVDRTSFLELPVTVKIEGKEAQVALKDLVRSYQTDAYNTQRSQANAEKARTWEAEQTQAKQALTQQLQVAQQVVQLAHQELMRDYQGTDWNKLQVENPQEWSVKTLQMQQRFAAIQQHFQQVTAQQQQQAAEAQQRMAQTVEAERERMLEVFPEWRDPQKFQAARTELSSYAKQIGFNDAELAGIADHRYMKVLHDASRYAALQARSPAVLKMVRAAPPMGAPGARTQRDPKAARLQQVREAGKAGRLARDQDAQVAAFSALVDAGA